MQVWYAQLAPTEQQRVMVGEATRSQGQNGQPAQSEEEMRGEAREAAKKAPHLASFLQEALASTSSQNARLFSTVRSLLTSQLPPC